MLVGHTTLKDSCGGLFVLEKGREMKVLSEKALQILEDERIFKIREESGKYFIVENCDEYFSLELTPDICRGLMEAFGKICDILE